MDERDITSHVGDEIRHKRYPGHTLVLLSGRGNGTVLQSEAVNSGSEAVSERHETRHGSETVPDSRHPRLLHTPRAKRYESRIETYGWHTRILRHQK